MDQDIIISEGEWCTGEPLTSQVVRGGKRILPAPSLEEIREVYRQDAARLPPGLRVLETGRYPVIVA